MSGILIKKGHLNTNTHARRSSCENKGCFQGEAYANQGMPEIANSLPKARERHGMASCSQALEGINTADTLSLYF